MSILVITRLKIDLGVLKERLSFMYKRKLIIFKNCVFLWTVRVSKSQSAHLCMDILTKERPFRYSSGHLKTLCVPLAIRKLWTLFTGKSSRVSVYKFISWVYYSYTKIYFGSRGNLRTAERDRKNDRQYLEYACTFQPNTAFGVQNVWQAREWCLSTSL